jgi:hypothetical protein
VSADYAIKQRINEMSHLHSLQMPVMAAGVLNTLSVSIASQQGVNAPHAQAFQPQAKFFRSLAPCILKPYNLSRDLTAIYDSARLSVRVLSAVAGRTSGADLCADCRLQSDENRVCVVACWG